MRKPSDTDLVKSLLWQGIEGRISVRSKDLASGHCATRKYERVNDDRVCLDHGA